MSGRVKLQYRTDGGWLHELHPLTKLGWLLGLTVGSFLVTTPWYPALAVVGLWGAAYLARIRPARDMRGWRLLLSTSAAFFALQVLFTGSGSAVADPSSVLGLVITDEGLRRGVLVAGRFLAVIMASQLFVLTTDPSGLAYALMRAGLPYRYGFALVTAIRLAPLFELEANTIYQAQLARGCAMMAACSAGSSRCCASCCYLCSSGRSVARSVSQFPWRDGSSDAIASAPFIERRSWARQITWR